MSGGPTTSTNQTTNFKNTTRENSAHDPWAPAQPFLKDVLSRAFGLFPTAQAAGQIGADFANPLQAFAGGLLGNGGGLGQMAPGLMDAYQKAIGWLTPTASGSEIGMDSPEQRSLLDMIQNRVQNQVGDIWGRAGRSFSAGHAGALGRGIAEGEAPVLFNQLNADRSRKDQAIQSILGAGYGTSGAVDASLGNALNARLRVPNLISQIMALRNAPVSSLSQLSDLVLPIAGLGGTANSISRSKGTANTMGTSSTSGDPFQTAIGAGLGGLGLLSMGPTGGLGGALGTKIAGLF